MIRTIITRLVIVAAMPAILPALPAIAQQPASDTAGNALAIDKTLGPRVFSGYRSLARPKRYAEFPDPSVMAQVWHDSIMMRPHTIAEPPDSLAAERLDSLAGATVAGAAYNFTEEEDSGNAQFSYSDLAFVRGEATPAWLDEAMERDRLQEDFIYTLMVQNPEYIEYAYWDLPKRPTLPEEDLSVRGYLKKLDLPQQIVPADSVDVDPDAKRINWLHTLNTSLQLSQAFVSANWYQGGTSYFALLANFLWDVQLNPVYHPNTMFQSTLSYKLAINSTPDDQFHKYSIAQDLFQYNLKAGYRAYKYWYYSFTTQFKTQFFNSYPTNSQVRSASFLSPGELNVGLGMTYSKENTAKTLKFSASISPIAYNMKTCIDALVDHETLVFPKDRKITHDYGSTAEVNFFANFWKNATYTTRLFLFTDYKNVQSDWEHTLNFQFSKLFSTQIYVHMRYDSAADPNVSKGWKKFMLKEILSFGLSYNFSTK